MSTPDWLAPVRNLIAGLIFGEAPRWHDGRLWLSDMLGGRVLVVTADGTLEPIADVPEGASGLGWLPDGRLLVISMTDAKLLAFQDGNRSVIADLSLSGGTPNDMVVDSQGRAYVGNAGCDLFVGIDPQPTNLLMIDSRGVHEVADDLIFPNGMIITPNGQRLIVAETFANKLTVFDINSNDGSLSNGREFAKLDGLTPDGICLDAEGAVWAGCADGNRFVRVLEGGEITHVIDTGERFATACVTGGVDREKLFMITAEMSPELFAAKQTSATISVTDLTVPGAGIP